MHVLTLRQIVAATDLTPASSVAIRGAAELAHLADAKLDAVHVYTPGVDHGEALDSLQAFLRDAGVSTGVNARAVPAHDPADALVDDAVRAHADLVVFGPHRGGGGLGSTARRMVEAARVPVLMLPGEPRLPFSRVLVPVDASDDDDPRVLEIALAWGAALRARDIGAEFVVLHVAEDGRCDVDEAQRTVEAHAEEVVRKNPQRWTGLRLRTECVGGNDAADGIVKAAAREEANLVVMGTGGRAAAVEHGRLSGVSAAVARTIRSPLLLLPRACWIDQP